MDAEWRDAGTVIEIVSGKWALAILQALESGPLRHNALRRELGISPQALAQNLRRLEKAGLVSREVGAGMPPAVSYALTGSAPELFRVLEGLARWGRKHLAR